MSAYLTKEGKTTDDVQNAGEFDHDAHMQKVNDYIGNMNDDEVETVIRDSEDVSTYVVWIFRANEGRSKSYNKMTIEQLQRRLMLSIDAELIAYAERNM